MDEEAATTPIEGVEVNRACYGFGGNPNKDGLVIVFVVEHLGSKSLDISVREIFVVTSVA